jgi:hypothetical protein
MTRIFAPIMYVVIMALAAIYSVFGVTSVAIKAVSDYHLF